ncbi:MAG: nicotinate (nicotinamide) nucleotide adenylyltransferase, partial [Oscillospiraceae bacterium]|nr:nicotinate (nicotinamide) nucleotide adenylyltransferase [Oscillospiraceae bacterium]
MKTLIYGGTFNPPHIGHVKALKAAVEQLVAERIIVIPTAEPPHKQMDISCTSDDRVEMCRLAFSAIDGAEVSDMEITRGGKSYTVDTVRELMVQYPDDEFVLLVGTDMITSFTNWREAQWLMDNVMLAAFPRNAGDVSAVAECAKKLGEECGARVMPIRLEPVEISSSEVRAMLPQREGNEYLSDEVYSFIIQKRLYNAKPNFEWLREKAYSMLKPSRIAHVKGCEEEAVRLARRFGGNKEDAAEAAILHDITKKLSLEEQRAKCVEFGILLDEDEYENAKLIHSKTGAAIAKAQFGISDEVYEAIKWHTTGKAGMSL